MDERTLEGYTRSYLHNGHRTLLGLGSVPPEYSNVFRRPSRFTDIAGDRRSRVHRDTVLPIFFL